MITREKILQAYADLVAEKPHPIGNEYGYYDYAVCRYVWSYMIGEGVDISWVRDSPELVSIFTGYHRKYIREMNRIKKIAHAHDTGEQA